MDLITILLIFPILFLLGIWGILLSCRTPTTTLKLGLKGLGFKGQVGLVDQVCEWRSRPCQPLPKEWIFMHQHVDLEDHDWLPLLATLKQLRRESNLKWSRFHQSQRAIFPRESES